MTNPTVPTWLLEVKDDMSKTGVSVYDIDYSVFDIWYYNVCL